MMVHALRFEQKLPVDKDTLWTFVASPLNLRLITPEYMKFKVTSELKQALMYPGMMITYKVSPLFNIPLNWCTEITHVEEGVYFVDEQRQGPYRIWHHEHHLKEISGGTIMTDILHYQLPLGPIGELAHALFVKKQLKNIFDFRYKKLEVIFGKM